MKEGDTRSWRCRWSEHGAAADLRRGLRAARLDRAPLAALARPRRVPRPPLADLPAAQRADAQGLSATRRPARCVAAATTSLPETPGGERNWDYRYSWIRDATFMLWGLYTLGFDWEANDFFYFIADVAEAEEGQLQIMYGIDGERRAARGDARPPLRLRGRAPGPDRQRRLRPGPARRLGRDPRLVLPPHEVARPPAGADLADPRQAGRDGARELARARPRHLGGARRAEALHLVEADVLGRGRPRRAPGGDPRGPRVRRPLAGGRRRDPRRHLRERGSTSAASSPSTTTPTRSTRRCC